MYKQNQKFVHNPEELIGQKSSITCQPTNLYHLFNPLLMLKFPLTLFLLQWSQKAILLDGIVTTMHLGLLDFPSHIFLSLLP